MDDNQGISGILLSAAGGAEALRQIWAYKKALDRKFSLTYVGKKLGVESRGTLSEMMKGIRRWPRKYWKPLCQALELDGDQSELMLLLLEFDEVTRAESEQLQKEIGILRRYMQERFFKRDLRHGLTLLASDIFCYLGVTPAAVPERTIIENFGKSRFQETMRALQVLVDNGMIERIGKDYRRNDVTTRFFSFHQNELEHSKTFLRESMLDAERLVADWLNKPRVSCFGTTTMSVKREQFEKVLVQIKKDVFRYFSDLETNDGDTIVRFNMQIYPVLSLSERNQFT